MGLTAIKLRYSGPEADTPSTLYTADDDVSENMHRKPVR